MMRVPEFERLANGFAQAVHLGLARPVKIRQRLAGVQGVQLPVARHEVPVDAAHEFAPAKYLPEVGKTRYDGVTALVEFDSLGDLKGGAISIYQYKGGKLEYVETLGAPVEMSMAKAEVKEAVAEVKDAAKAVAGAATAMGGEAIKAGAEAVKSGAEAVKGLSLIHI